MTGDLAQRLHEDNADIADRPVTPAHLAELVTLIDEGVVGSAQAKRALDAMYGSAKGARQVVDELGLAQVSDIGRPKGPAKRVIGTDIHPVNEYSTGKDAARKFVVGQIMRATKGRANPSVASNLVSSQRPEVHTGYSLEVVSERIPDRSIDLIYADPGQMVADIWEELKEMKRVLKDTGRLYFHCSPEMVGMQEFMDEVLESDCLLGIPWGEDTIWLYSPRGVRRYRTSAFSPWQKISPVEAPTYLGEKPLSLLERIVEKSSNPGDVVLDPFCGSGTTLVAAKRRLRRSIGIDKSPEATAMTEQRLARSVIVNEAGYLPFLKELGVKTDGLAPNSGRILRMINGRDVPGVYFNRNRGGVIHFTLNVGSVSASEDLWVRLPDEQVKRVDHGKPNVFPMPGMERQAFRQLLESAGSL